MDVYRHKLPRLPLTHGELGGLDAAQGGPFLHHEAQQPRQDGGDRPGRVPGVRVEIRNGQTQPGEKNGKKGKNKPKTGNWGGNP